MKNISYSLKIYEVDTDDAIDCSREVNAAIEGPVPKMKPASSQTIEKLESKPGKN